MKNIFRLSTICLLLFMVSSAYSQEVKEEELTKRTANALLEKAEFDFEEGNYLDALEKFTRLYEYKKSDLYYKMMKGICLTYDPDQKDEAIEILEQVKITNPEYNLINFYLGKAYAVNYEFDKAVNLFNMFNARATNEDASQKALAKQMILNCQNAKEILADTIKKNEVVNIKYPINSQYSEYTPVISGDESVMIFTYRGIKSKGADKVEEQSMGSEVYTEDVFVSYKKDGEWSEPVSIGDNINTEEHDAPIGLSVDGQTLFIYKTDGGKNDIYMSNLTGGEWSKPTKLKGDVNKKDSWEGSCSLSANGKLLYFSSDRAGGKGGRDIYTAELQPDGTWGNVVNLADINTVYNEDAPFIHPDGITLYFSSEGHTSVGGYDIFSSTYADGYFQAPQNLGYPINTVDDNRYFVLAADGQTGYYSGGGQNSIGEQDIFKIIAGKLEKPVLALLLGKVYFNDVETGSYMNLYDKNADFQLEGSFKSNEETGKYVMALKPGSYEIEVELDNGLIVKDSINLGEITEYIVLKKDFRIYDDSSLVAQNDPSLQALLDAELKKENKTIDTLFADNMKADIELEEMDAGRSFTLNNILYDFDKATLRPESKTELDRLVVILNEQATIKVEISSHTDAKRNVEMAKKIFARKGLTYSKEAHDKMSGAYNKRLSQRRAQSVVDYLVKKGIAKDRLVATGYGEEKPIAPNTNEDGSDNPEGRQQNRRTEFKVLE